MARGKTNLLGDPMVDLSYGYGRRGRKDVEDDKWDGKKAPKGRLRVGIGVYR